MIAASFPESNGVLDPPPGVSLEECTALSVWRGPNTAGQPVVVSCWMPTMEEMAMINKTGRVWLVVWGHSMQPAALSGTSPFG